MIVLLLSLLNDNDLSSIKEFLESTYKLKADRRSLELLILKVVPLLSINSRIFLKSLVPATEGFPLSSDRDEDHSHIWNVFVRRILNDGYLLPASISELGREKFSWIMKWPNDGIKSTSVFNSLQFQGRLRTMNEIPPIELHPEAAMKEITAIMTDGSQYTIGYSDLEKITCVSQGIYSIQEAGPNPHNHTLIIDESQINGDLYEAIRKTNVIVQKFNSLLATPRAKDRMAVLWRRGSVMRPVFLSEFKGSGRLFRSVARLDQPINTILAVAYKVEGKKLTRTDSIRNMARDIGNLTIYLSHIEHRLSEVEFGPFRPDGGDLRRKIEEAKGQLAAAEQSRSKIGNYPDLSEEPIERCLYPEGSDVSQPEIWNEFSAWCPESNGLLHIKGKSGLVNNVRWLKDDLVELSLSCHEGRVFVTPLRYVEEGYRQDEVQQGDVAILAGRYVIIAENESRERERNLGLFMTNYLKITSIEEQKRTRRGENRARQSDAIRTCCFR